MRSPGGLLSISYPDGATIRQETYSCRHCNTVTVVKPQQRAEDIGGLCKCCMGLICPRCVGQDCVPLLKRVEAAEASYHARRSYGF